MNKLSVFAISALVTLGAIFTACEDTQSDIGGSLVGSEVTIVVDSAAQSLVAKSVEELAYDARTTSKLLGRINVPEYGSLDCSFVSQLMSATKLEIPDSIKVEDVDSMRVVLTIPRGSLTGDSLAPQQMKIYQLTKQLPIQINNQFNPDGYYNKANPLGVKSYTLSALGMTDSAFLVQSDVNVKIKLQDQLAKKYFTMYRDSLTRPVFNMPQTFAKVFPGVYVEQNFGNGCVGVISDVKFYLYWRYYTTTKFNTGEKDKDGNYIFNTVKHLLRDSVCIFSSQPEVLSSNCINYQPAASLKAMAQNGNTIITTPGGYRVDFTFPVAQYLNKYAANLNRLSVVSTLEMFLPAKEIKNDHGIGVAPYLLMVKSSERENFFKNNKIPDNKTSFYATYSSTTGGYTFSGMRDYIVDLIKSGKPVTAEDTDFSLVPVMLTLETQTEYNTEVTYVTKCVPYVGRPTMTQLDMNNAVINFVFSQQMIKQ